MASAPPKTLVSPQVALEGFQRIDLAAGEKRELTFDLGPLEMSEVDETGLRKVVAGDYVVFIGGSQPAAQTANSAYFKVVGEMVLPQ